MPTVDFTLEDITKQTTQIVEQALMHEREYTKSLFEQERETTKSLITEALAQERNVTKSLITEALVEDRETTKSFISDALLAERENTRTMVQEVVSREFLSFWESNLAPVLDEILDDVHDLKHTARAGRITKASDF